jgi:hypothetical protein
MTCAEVDPRPFHSSGQLEMQAAPSSNTGEGRGVLFIRQHNSNRPGTAALSLFQHRDRLAQEVWLAWAALWQPGVNQPFASPCAARK